MGHFTFLIVLMAVGLITITLMFGYLWMRSDEPPPWKPLK
jgi:hypothetical protein